MDLSFVLVLAIVAYLLALKLIPKVRKATWEFAQAYLHQRDCVYVASPDYRSHSSSQFLGA
jgi:hypothetical protein